MGYWCAQVAYDPGVPLCANIPHCTLRTRVAGTDSYDIFVIPMRGGELLAELEIPAARCVYRLQQWIIDVRRLRTT